MGLLPCLECEVNSVPDVVGDRGCVEEKEKDSPLPMGRVQMMRCERQ